MRFLFRFVFHAFIFWSFVWVFTRKPTQFGFSVDRIDRVVSFVSVVFGVVEMILFSGNFFDDNVRVSMMALAFGEHWVSFWVWPFTYLVLMQLLWIETFRKSKVLRVILALWVLLLLHMEFLVILITSLHRDYL